MFERGAYLDRAARRRDRRLAWRGSASRFVVLAGYMQLLDPAFLARFESRVVNVHRALLPAFLVRAVEQALDYGSGLGVAVHFVDEGVDTGRIIAQRALELPEATEADEVRDAAPARARPAVRGVVDRLAAGP